MNIILGVVAFFICIFFGRITSQKYIEVCKYYNDFKNFNDKLKNEISFGQASILSIIKNNTETSDFYDCIKTYFNNNEFNFNGKYLSDLQIDFLKNYLETIGNGDKQSQIKFLNECDAMLKENLKNAQEDEKKYLSLYKKISFLIGLVALIIFL